MIRFIIIALIIPSIAMVAGYLIENFPATVAINVMGYTVKTNLIIWLLLSIIASLILIWIFRVIRFLWHSPEIFSRNAEKRKNHKANTLLKQGLNDMIAGDYPKAEKKLAKGGQLAENLGLSSVLYFENAAIAADQQQAFKRRDQYFLKARESASKKDSKLTHISEAQSCIDNKEYGKALGLLEELRDKGLKNQKLLTLLDAAYAGKGDWANAWRNLTQLRNYLPADEFNARKGRYAREMLADTAAIETYEQLQSAWKRLPAELRQEKDMLLQYSSSLIENGHAEEAEKLLASHLRAHADIDFIQAYSQLRGINFRKALTNMDRWENQYPDSPIFLYCKARLAFRAGDLELANQLVERSIKQRPSAEAFALWGQILEALKQPEAALSAYRHSITDQTEQKTLQGELLPSPEASSQ